MSEPISIEAGPTRNGRVSEFLAATIRHHLWFIAYVLAFVLIAAAVLVTVGRDYEPVNKYYLLAAALPPFAAVAFVVLGHFIYHAVHVRPFRPSALFRDIVRDDKLRVQRLLYALVPILLILLFKSAFTALKTAIPYIQPFAHDVVLMEIDRALHFGQHPWEWLQPILGYAPVTSAISLLYKFWFGFIYFFFFWQAFSMTDPVLRMRYLLSYVLSWSLLGSLAAIGLSSAGPCYFGLVTGGPDPYAPLLHYLGEADQSFRNWSLIAQDYLWQNYQSGGVDAASGISAMPSVHVAIATLQALLGWHISRKMGWLTTAYCAVVMIGSVHLGWHYAIDGYVSILAVVAIWKGVGWALRFHPSFAWAEGDGASEEAAEAAPAR